MFNAVTLYSGSGSGAQAAVNVPELIRDNQNRNNTGHVQVIGAGTVSVEGSANGTNWITIVSGVTASNGFHIALFPFMRANVTTASGTTSLIVVL